MKSRRLSCCSLSNALVLEATSPEGSSPNVKINTRMEIHPPDKSQVGCNMCALHSSTSQNASIQNKIET